MTPEQEMETQKRRKKKTDSKLQFDPGKVFTPGKEEDVELDLETAHYKARHGQGGDRRGK